MDVLAGARDERHLNDLRRLLARGTLLATESTDYEEAAALYRTCLRGGETVRKMIDCLIASIAIRTGTPVLHHDTDFDVFARHTSLQIDRSGRKCVPGPAIWATPHVALGGASSVTRSCAWLTRHGLILRQQRSRAGLGDRRPGTRPMPLSEVHLRSGRERQPGADQRRP